MLLFPFPCGEQKLSINTLCDVQREVTIRSTFPANQRIILQGGAETTSLRKCPKIGFRLAHIRHPVIRDKCCDTSCEWHELMNHVHIAYNHEPGIAAWLSGFVSNSEKIIRGESEDWKLRRVEIGMDDIILRYDNGEISGDAVLEGFRGRLYFGVPMRWRLDELRAVMVEMEEDEHGGRSVKIESDLPCDFREDKACLQYYEYCVCVSMRLARTADGTIELTRRYLFSELDEPAIHGLTEYTLGYLLGTNESLQGAPTHRAIGL